MPDLRSGWCTGGPAFASVRYQRLVASRANSRAVRFAARVSMSGKESAQVLRPSDPATPHGRHCVVTVSWRLPRGWPGTSTTVANRPDQTKIDKAQREAPSRTHLGGASPCPFDRRQLHIGCARLRRRRLGLGRPLQLHRGTARRARTGLSGGVRWIGFSGVGELSGTTWPGPVDGGHCADQRDAEVDGGFDTGGVCPLGRQEAECHGDRQDNDEEPKDATSVAEWVGSQNGDAEQQAGEDHAGESDAGEPDPRDAERAVGRYLGQHQ
jgi:hypothetical protein